MLSLLRHARQRLLRTWEAPRDGRSPEDSRLLDAYGAPYVLDFTIVGPGGEGIIRSHWIVRRDEDFPRLTSCHVR